MSEIITEEEMCEALTIRIRKPVKFGKIDGVTQALKEVNHDGFEMLNGKLKILPAPDDAQ